MTRLVGRTLIAAGACAGTMAMQYAKNDDAAQLARQKVADDAAAADANSTVAIEEEEVEVEHPATHRQELKNFMDLQYTGVINVGGQDLNMIIDTGSFESVVFSTACDMCGDKKNLYNSKKAKDYKNTSVFKILSYGSGTVYTYSGKDTFSIGPITAPRQTFWNVEDAEMSIAGEGTFAGIFGIGPPFSAVTNAEEEATEVHAEADEYTNSGGNLTDAMKTIIQSYDDARDLEENVKQFLEKRKMHSISSCFGAESGTPGWQIWHDKAHLQHPDLFTTVQNVGDVYWSAELTKVVIGDSKSTDRMTLECGSTSSCVAVIDTGTSLIMAPPGVATMVQMIVKQWLAAGNTCDDISALPDLEFSLNGQPFSLPAEAYVGTLSGEMADETGGEQKSRYIKLAGQDPYGDSPTCSSIIFPMDVGTQKGSMWIFGMPFFRKYYTTFNLKETKDGRLVASNMSMSTARTKDCEIVPAKNNVEETMPLKRRAQVHVDLSKIRLPHFGQDSKSLRPKKLGAKRKAKAFAEYSTKYVHV